MAAVDFTDISIRSANPIPFNRAMAQKPTYGSGFIIDRPGSRWMFEMATAMMRVEPDWRLLAARFDDAERLGGLFVIPQPGFDPGTPGSAVVDATTSSGREVPITGASPHYAVKRGQWVSFVVDGQRYADRIAEQAILDASGEGTIRLRNLLRVPLTAGDTVELAEPKVEGIVEVTSREPLTPVRVAAFEWTVTEAR